MRALTTMGLAAVLSSVGLRADAFCDQAAASQADRDLWDHHGCFQDFYRWQAGAYALSANEWTGRGWDDACKISLEYPKHWNAAYLITYGLSDNSAQFHGTMDYRATAEAASSPFHAAIRASIGDGIAAFGTYDNGVVTTYCLLYDLAYDFANPASRGGDFMHEGWHAWLHKYNYDNGSASGHRPGPLGNCAALGCDYFYFHGIGDYAFGELWQHDSTGTRFHSPNQVQVEYLCDIADQASPWVPLSVKLAARADANYRATDLFINGPGYSCGNPSPL